MKEFLKNSGRLLVLTFFAGLLLIGTFIYTDYGLSWDEPSARFRGILNYQYIFSGNQDLLIYESRYHGPAFELFLIFLEIASGLKELREIYFLRHLATFLLFYVSVICFYQMCKVRFDSWKAGLLGALFYVVSPRVFAHAFYNSKDGAFLAMFVISMYTMRRYLEKQTVGHMIAHAIVCGLLFDIRILGGLVPFFTYLFVIGEIVAVRPLRDQIKRKIAFLLVYSVLCVNVIILCFPVLWQNPLQQFFQSFAVMKEYNWVGTALYWGQYFKAPDLPWHYAPVWIAITTPLLYVLGFLPGTLLGLVHVLHNPLSMFQSRQKQSELMFWLWGIFPLVLILAMGAVVYDGWRHLLFIYPGLLGIALHGLAWGKQMLEIRLPQHLRKQGQWIVAGIVGLSLLSPVWFMVRYHPYQNLYFNRLAGKNMATIKQRFDLDYWGLSYRKALEYIVGNDPSPRITVHDPNLWAAHRLHILPEADRQRIVLVDELSEADYFISNYRWHPEEYPYAHEVFSVKIGGTNIMVVYKTPFDEQ